jgi:ketosteroid isomerase-like protein
MSEENVESVRAIYESFNRTGEPDWELFHPDAVLDISSVPGFGVVKGREAALEVIRQYAAVFDQWRISVEEVIPGEGERVFSAVRDGGRIKGTEDEIFNPFFHAWEFQDGKVIAWQTFQSRDQALKAAGLEE